MLGVAMYTTIKTLMEKGLNKSQIVRATGHDWKTVAKVIRGIEMGKEEPEKKPHPVILDAYKEKVVQLMEEGLTGVRIHQELQKLGVKIGYSTVKNYLTRIKKREKIFVRIQTYPAEKAQVDFGYVGLTMDNNGKKRRTWIFNMRLSYSRLDYYEKVYDQGVETFIQCHINAFNYFGGVPRVCKNRQLKGSYLRGQFL